jgi:hypothetical protein
MASSVRYFSSKTLAFLHNRARIFKLLRSPGIDFKGTNSAQAVCVAWRAGTTTYSYTVPSPHRLFKIPAQINLIFLEERDVFLRHEQNRARNF